MNEELRKACKTVLDDLVVYTDFDCSCKENVDALEAFAKQQRAEVWREAAKEIDSYNDDMGRFDPGLQRKVEWMEQQAKELDA